MQIEAAKACPLPGGSWRAEVFTAEAGNGNLPTCGGASECVVEMMTNAP